MIMIEYKRQKNIAVQKINHLKFLFSRFLQCSHHIQLMTNVTLNLDKKEFLWFLFTFKYSTKKETRIKLTVSSYFLWFPSILRREMLKYLLEEDINPSFNVP